MSNSTEQPNNVFYLKKPDRASHRASQCPQVPRGQGQVLKSSQIIKAQNAYQSNMSIKKYSPSVLAETLERKPVVSVPVSPVQDLKQNFAQLEGLQARFRFMLKELENQLQS